MSLKDLIVKTETERAYLKALAKLRAAGWNVAPSDIPGLTYVGGHELTLGQVLDLAAKQQ